MNANAIRYFLKVARSGSFRGASQVLHVAASAINRQMSILEKDVGAELFERNRGRKKLRLTLAGEIFMAHARSAANEIEAAYHEIGALKRVPTGNVVLGVPETFIHDFLPEFLARFRNSYPHVSFRVVVAASPQLVELLLRDEIGIALIYNQKVPPSIKVVIELERRTCMMVRSDHPLANRSYVGLLECAGCAVVMPERGTSMRGLYDRIFAQLKVKPRFGVTTTSYEMLRSAVRAGLGVAIVNEDLTLSPDGYSSDVKFVPIRHPVVKPQRLLCCIRSRRKLAAATAVFADELEQAFQALRKNR